MITSEQIKTLARETGFHACGITKAKRFPEAEETVQKWVDAGNHAGMKFMEQFDARAADFWSRLPWAKSVIVLGVNYYSKFPKAGPEDSSGFELSAATAPGLFGRVARYAWGMDYHKIINARLELLKEKILQAYGETVEFESTVDTKPILERSLAQEAGLGFLGKQGQLISLEYGPWLFLASLITSLELAPDSPCRDTCGRCNKCVSACPMGAVLAGHGIDARKCISYLTIEHQGDIPDELSRRLGDKIFGCDTCLEACPFTAWQKETDWEELKPGSGCGPQLSLRELVEIQSDEQFNRKFKDTSLLRCGRKRLLRNASVVLNNLLSDGS